jgi:hypothetical protein
MAEYRSRRGGGVKGEAPAAPVKLGAGRVDNTGSPWSGRLHRQREVLT